ncbi:MAG: phage capsid protein [Fusobacteriaceae bacterium]
MALTKQELFSAAMLTYMSELNGGFLKKFAETMVQSNGESCTFNRLGESTAADGVTSLFGSGAGTGTNGDMVAIKATIAPISSSMKITEMDMNKTAIDIKSAYVKSLGNAINRKEDSKILAACKALSAKKAPTKPTNAAAGTECRGVQAATYTADADVKKIIGAIRRAHAFSKLTPDNHKGLALAISPDNWADLSTSEYVLNNDYSAVFGGGTNGEPTTFYGAEVIIVEDTTNVGDATDNTSYLIPSNSICYAAWESSTRGDAIFYPTDSMRWHLQAYKSIGVAIAEPHVITKIVKTVVA